MLCFHIDSLQVLGSNEIPHTLHHVRGQLKLPAAVQEAIFSHPHLHEGLPGPPCQWLPNAPEHVACLGPHALQDVGATTNHPVVRALAVFAKEVQGHAILWRGP